MSTRLHIPGKAALAILATLLLAGGVHAQAQVPPQVQAPPRAGAAQQAVEDGEPDRVRGQVLRLDGDAVQIRTRGGRNVRVVLGPETTVLKLSKGSFTDVDFGTYVGAVAVRLDQYSPIIRDSAVWLHRGYELRIIDEQLRGIALGEKKWDLPAGSIISHGWVDDLEERVISVKWGPSDYDETDIEIPRDAPVLKMALGSRDLLKAGAQVFAGLQADRNGKAVAAFIFVGMDGVAPPM